MNVINPNMEPPAFFKPPNDDLNDMDVLCTFNIRIESKIKNMGVSRTSDHFKIKIKMLNPSQELSCPPKLSLRTQKIWMFSAPSKSRKRTEIQSRGLLKTSGHIDINIKLPNPNQEPSVSSKDPNQD